MKKYAILIFAAVLSALIASDVSAQSELFGEKINENFTEAIEPELLQKADDPATAPYDFMLIAKRLGVYGSPKAAPVMAKWLGEPAKSHSARTALEEMPFDEALAELRAAVDKVNDPLLKAGVIGSLGMRRDKASVAVITPLLSSDSPQIAEAALFALSRIADPASTAELLKKLSKEESPESKKAGDLLLMHGEFLRRDGHQDEAEKVFFAVAETSPYIYQKESAYYQILLRASDAAGRWAAEWLAGSDPLKFRSTLRAAAFVRNDAMTDALLASYEKVDASSRPAILAALGDQKNLKGQALLMTELGSEDENIQTAAISAMKAFADRDSLGRLIEAALGGDENIRRESVAVIELFDDDVDPEILRLLDGDDTHRALGAELAGARKIADARPALFELAKNGSPAVRRTAIAALGQVAGEEEFAWLLAQAIGPEGEVADAAKTGLKAACGNRPNRDAAAAVLAQTADSLKGETEKRLFVFESLAALGGPAAREAVERAALASDKESSDLATKTLGAWMDPDVAPILLKIAQTPNHPFGNRSLRGALRIARQFAMPDWLRAAIVRDALASPACGDREKEVADIIVKQYRLDLSKPETDGQKQLRNIEIRRAVYGIPDDPEKLKDVTETVREKFLKADSPVVRFSEGYNKAFGGDPAPGVHKKIVLTFKNRASGEVRDIEFGEGSAIDLSTK